MPDKKNKYLSFLFNCHGSKMQLTCPFIGQSYDMTSSSATPSATPLMISSPFFPISGLLHSLLPPLLKTVASGLTLEFAFWGTQARTAAYITAPAEGTWSCLPQLTLPTFQRRIKQEWTPNPKAANLLTKAVNKTLDLVWENANKLNTSLGNWEIEKRNVKLLSSRLWYK